LLLPPPPLPPLLLLKLLPTRYKFCSFRLA
jgi:hypothetical protein